MVHMKLGDDMGPLKCLNYKRLNMVWQVQVCRLDKFKLRIVYPAQKSLKYRETINWGKTTFIHNKNKFQIRLNQHEK